MNTRLLRPATAFLVAALVVGCGSDDAPTAERSSAVTTAAPETTATETTEVTTTTAAQVTTVPETTVPETTAAPSTTEAEPVGWQTVGPMPSAAYLPCCASNYVGDPSPQIPTDPSAALPAGIYKAFRQQPADGEAFDPNTITFSLAPFVACGTPDIFCEDGFVDGEVGVGEVARDIAMPLDRDVRIVVAGFGCNADSTNFETLHQAATGVEFAALQTAFEAAYQSELVSLIAADTSYDDFQTIFAEPRSGFAVPCLAGAGQLVYQAGEGPTILLQLLGEYDDATGEVVVAPSISTAVIYLTALEVAADGSQTLYFYASFLS